MSRVFKKWSKRADKHRLRGFRAGTRGRWLSSSTFLWQQSTAFFGRTNHSLIGCGPLPLVRIPNLERSCSKWWRFYMKPPDNAVVLCVDEKTGIQALDRTSTAAPPFTGTKWEVRMYPVTIDENQGQSLTVAPWSLRRTKCFSLYRSLQEWVVSARRTAPVATATFARPTAITVLPSGVVYVVETVFNGIRKIEAGIVSTLASRTKGYADGPLSTTALFNEPGGIFRIGRTSVTTQFLGRYI
jgi:hypothetical protein